MPPLCPRSISRARLRSLRTPASSLVAPSLLSPGGRGARFGSRSMFPALLVRAGLLLDPVGELGDLRVDRAPLGHQPADLAVRVDDGGVVAAAELLPDLREREVGQFTAQVHGD